MIFNGTFSYLIRNTDLYGLSRYNHKSLTDNDFTIISKVKPNLDIELGNDGIHTGYIVCKNGLHIGTYFMKAINENGYLYQFGCAYSTNYNEQSVFNYLNIEVNPTDDYYHVSMIHSKKSKTITLIVNDIEKTVKYEGELVDYSNSWLWVGAACGAEDYDERYSYFYQGEIGYVGIFSKELNNKIIFDILSKDEIINYDSVYSPILITDFKEITQYKIKDKSNNGNHLVIYNNEWI
jgi:hypothetical protein